MWRPHYHPIHVPLRAVGWDIQCDYGYSASSCEKNDCVNANRGTVRGCGRLPLISHALFSPFHTWSGPVLAALNATCVIIAFQIAVMNGDLSEHDCSVVPFVALQLMHGSNVPCVADSFELISICSRALAW